MGNIIMIHRWFGGLILPALIIMAGVWFTATWKPDAWPGRPARLFRLMVDAQFLLGLSFWLYMVLIVGAGARYLAFPFLFHPIMGLLAASVATLSVRPHGAWARLGRWAPLASLGLLLAVVLAAGIIARTV